MKLFDLANRIRITAEPVCIQGYYTETFSYNHTLGCLSDTCGALISGVMNFIFDEQAILKQSAVWTMPAFLETYTLQDSALYEVRARSSAELLIFIDWDLHWNKTISSAHNLLVIRFATNYWTQWTSGAWEQPTLDGATSEVVSQIEREQMLNDKRFDLRAYQNERDDIQAPMMDASLTQTIFNFMNWGECKILHSSEVSFACFDEAGNSGEMPFEKATGV